MGNPDWSKIPFEKMPEWKRQEILQKNKKQTEQIKQIEKFICPVCQKECKGKAGLAVHLTSHNK